MLKFSSKFSNNLINLEKQYGFDYFDVSSFKVRSPTLYYRYIVLTVSGAHS